jgi:two-component system invasion response regulator UvrY
MVRILIADDHEIVRQGLKELLSDEFPDAFIEDASDTVSLLEKQASQQWDIVISDLIMPGGGGFRFLEIIRASNKTLPVIIISTHPADQYESSVIKAGANMFINKDTISADLPKAIRSLLSLS